MRRKWLMTAAVAMMLLGLGVLLYPAVSSAINRWNGSYAIQQFQEQLDHMSNFELETQLEHARLYNARLSSLSEKSPETESGYDQILDFGNGIMGYIHIPGIQVKLPIYHGVSNEVLEKGVGHLSSSAFPIPGSGNHTVLTGHTGLPSASLFTDLDKLQEGAQFYVTVGGESLIYQVDQIRVVLPEDTEALQPIPGKEYCTLVTCTPYGVNSHRLLVRGIRMDVAEEIQQEQIFSPVVEENRRDVLWLFLIPVAGFVIGILRKRGRK